ncbi:MAG: hypothetical protein QW350_05200 [Candidatus Aenigmatarchaeota archaeon]
MKINQIIIKWLKEKKTSKKFGYFVDEESFRIRFPSEIETDVMNVIGDTLKDIPYMISYNMWDDLTIYIFLNHPRLQKEKLYTLLTELEIAEEIIEGG